ncbi:MAG: hypothetical protein ACHQFZ_07815 [Acidimicrobiales bacterium]
MQAALASCPRGALYSVSPIQLSMLSYILPLGNFNPLPSDHLYFVITRGSNTNQVGPTKNVPLFSPGNVTVFQIGRQIQTTNGKVVNTDYYLSFAPCRQVSGTFGHVSTLGGPLAGIRFTNCEKPYSIGNGSEYGHCTAQVDIRVRAGTRIGTAGGKSSAALDFGSDDIRVSTPAVANPHHNYDLFATCAVSYYQGTLKKDLQSLLGPGQVGVKETHGCGRPFQDKIGTLQGDWYRGPPQVANFDITRQLALVHVNFDPTVEAISFGGTIAPQGVLQFTPSHVGRINRSFSEVTPGPTIYCYQSQGVAGRVLIQLVSATTLNIEYQSLNCSAGIMFASPFHYQR